MRLLVSQDSLKKAVSLVATVVPSRAPLQAIENIVLEAGEGNLTFCGTDLQMWIRVSIPADVSEAGKALVPGKTFKDLVAKLPPAEVRISLEGDLIVFDYAKGLTKLATAPEADFPDLEFPEPEGEHRFTGTVLERALASSSIAAAKEEARYALRGVLIEAKGSKVTFVSTDGHRMALFETEVDVEAEFSTIVPLQAVSFIQKIARAEPELFLKAERGRFSVRGTDFQLVTQVYEEEFPPYRDVIPTEFRSTARVPKVELEDALDRITVLARERDNQIFLKLVPGEGVSLRTETELGSTEERIPAAVEGEEMEVAFNAKYLKDPLKHVESDEVEVGLTGELSPAQIRDLGGEFLYVLMPLRV